MRGGKGLKSVAFSAVDLKQGFLLHVMRFKPETFHHVYD